MYEWKFVYCFVNCIMDMSCGCFFNISPYYSKLRVTSLKMSLIIYISSAKIWDNYGTKITCNTVDNTVTQSTGGQEEKPTTKIMEAVNFLCEISAKLPNI